MGLLTLMRPVCAQDPAKNQRWRFTHCGGFGFGTGVDLCVLTNVRVEDLLVAPLTLL